MTDGPGITQSGPCVLFMAFPSPHAPSLVAWTQFRAHIGRGAGEPRVRNRASMVNHQAGTWRLLASNNREIARCAFIYGSFAGARENVINLQSSLNDVSITTIHGPTSGTHGWFASMHQHIVFTCARWYETDSVSLEAGEGAVAALRCAAITDHVRVVATPRSRRFYA